MRLPKKIILLYHDVGINKGTIEHFVSFDNFKKQIRYMCEHYEIVSLEDFVADYCNNKKQAVISFDDCFPGIFDLAIPYLQSLHVKHYVFLSLVYRNGFFWRDALLQIIKNDSADMLKNYLKQKYPQQYSNLKSDLYRFTKSEMVDSRHLSNWLKSSTKYRIPINSDEFDYLVLSTAQKEWTEFGVHTKNHYVMSSLNANEQKYEILEVEKYFNNLDICYSKYFSLPFGEMHHLNDETMNVVNDLKYDGILLSRNRLGLSGSEPKLIERVMPLNTHNISIQLRKLSIKQKLKDFRNY